MDIEIGFGDAIKAVGNRVEGYLVRFGSPTATDLDGEFFDASTDFGRPMKSGDEIPLNLYYHHGLDEKVGKREVGTGTVKVDDVGLWYSGVLSESDAYLRAIGKLAQKGRLGFSSGAAAHLVEKSPVEGAKATRITRWPLAEASVTPTPAEPRNRAATKSLEEFVADAEPVTLEPEPEPAVKTRPESITEFERQLRDAFGYSRREAKALASHGYKALRDAASDETDPATDQAAAVKADLLRLLARQMIAAQAVEAA